MSIPTGFISPNLPIPIDEYDKAVEQRFRNALRLYFNLLDNQNFTLNAQVASNQTLIWLNM